jgi:hypothetical protein
MFFSLGFGQSKFYLPIIVFCYLLKMPTILFQKLNIDLIILQFLYLFFLLSAFSIGFDRMTLERPFIILISILIPIILGGFVFNYQKYEIKINLMWFYLFGLFISKFTVVIYSFLTDPNLYGYGLLISPYTGKELNSPGYSNMLAITFVYFFYFAIYEKKKIILRLLSLIMVILGLLSAIFLGGRAFFVIAIFTIIFYALFQRSFKTLFYFLCVASLFIYLISINKDLIYSLDFLMNRLKNGLDSDRFLLYKQGLSVFLDYPFGGFSVNTSMVNTKWFHNIFLDTARVAGWIPVVFFISALIYTAKFLFYKNKENNYIVMLCLCINVFLIMQQDVVLEGSVQSIVVLFFASFCLLDSKKQKVRWSSKNGHFSRPLQNSKYLRF